MVIWNDLFCSTKKVIKKKNNKTKQISCLTVTRHFDETQDKRCFENDENGTTQVETTRIDSSMFRFCTKMYNFADVMRLGSRLINSREMSHKSYDGKNARRELSHKWIWNKSKIFDPNWEWKILSATVKRGCDTRTDHFSYFFQTSIWIRYSENVFLISNMRKSHF